MQDSIGTADATTRALRSALGEALCSYATRSQKVLQFLNAKVGIAEDASQNLWMKDR